MDNYTNKQRELAEMLKGATNRIITADTVGEAYHFFRFAVSYLDKICSNSASNIDKIRREQEEEEN